MDMTSKVFYAVAKDNLHTRKEISTELGVSLVTVGKAVEHLIAAGVLSSNVKCTSDIGRRSDFIEVSTDLKVLLIDLSGRDLAYSITPLGEVANVRCIPRVDSLDFYDNLVLLINDIKKHIDSTPAKILVALPGEVDGGRIKNTLIDDYSGFDIAEMLEKRCLLSDVLISCANALETSGNFMKNDIFISISESIWGTCKRNKIENWGDIYVDSRGEFTYAEALSCSLDEKKITDYSLRFLRAIDGVLAPERIFLSSDRLSDSIIASIKENMPSVVHVNANEMIFDGLMELAMAQILKEISNKR